MGENFVLTAAHCFIRYNEDERIDVVVGDFSNPNYKNNITTSITPATVTINPNFTDGSFPANATINPLDVTIQNDVAVLKLNQSVSSSKVIPCAERATPTTPLQSVEW